MTESNARALLDAEAMYSKTPEKVREYLAMMERIAAEDYDSQIGMVAAYEAGRMAVLEQMKTKMQSITKSTEGWDRGELQVTFTEKGIGRWSAYRRPTYQGGSVQAVEEGIGESSLEDYLTTTPPPP